MSVTSEEILLNLKSYIIGHSQFFNQHPLTEFPFIIDGRQGEQSLKLAFSFNAPKVDGSSRITSCTVQRLWNHTNDEWGLEDMQNIVVLVDLSDSASIQLVYHLVEALSACEDLSGGNRAQAVKVKSVHVVDFDPLAEYYPFLCGSLNDLASCYPTEVFSNLYLSGKGPAREGRVMTHLGITHVVNAASFNFPNHFAEKASNTSVCQSWTTSRKTWKVLSRRRCRFCRRHGALEAIAGPLQPRNQPVCSNDCGPPHIFSEFHMIRGRFAACARLQAAH